MGPAAVPMEEARTEAVDQLARLPLGGDEVEPAARQHLLAAQADHPAGEDVEATEIV